MASQYKDNTISELEINGNIETEKRILEEHIVESFENILNPVNHTYEPKELNNFLEKRNLTLDKIKEPDKKLLESPISRDQIRRL